MVILRSVWMVLLSLVVVACATGPGRGGEQGRDVAVAQVRLGVGYMQQGHYDLAYERLRKALVADPGYAGAHYSMALLYERLDRPERAVHHYRKALSLDEEYGEARNAFGVYLCRQGKYREAEKEFLRAARTTGYPTPELAYTNAALCARQSGHPRRADDYYRRALALDSRYRDALFGLAELNLEQGKYLQARAFVQRLEAAGELGAAALRLAVQVEKALGAAEVAERYRRLLLERFPDSPEARDYGRGGE